MRQRPASVPIMPRGLALGSGFALMSERLRPGLKRIGMATGLGASLVAILAEPLGTIRGAFGSAVVLVDDVLIFVKER